MVKQKRRRFAPEKNQAINEEVHKLQANEMIREVHYPVWLANVVVMNKKNIKNKLCINFTNLKKACLNDIFWLPMIDCLVNATTVQEMMSFLDALSGYNQILMHPDNQDTKIINPS